MLAANQISQQIAQPEIGRGLRQEDVREPIHGRVGRTRAARMVLFMTIIGTAKLSSELDAND